jgi:DNA-binding MarR family transcriptional regulator
MKASAHIAKIREFNRFYTGVIGLLDKYILNSQYTLSEVRVLYELATRENLTASELIETLHIDKGYLSRMLLELKTKNLIQSKRSAQDGRALQLSLTQHGRKEFKVLNQASDRQLAAILERLTDAERVKLVGNMNEIKAILSKTQ